MRLSLLSLLLAVLVTACGPTIETRYSYNPPSGADGMSCVRQCEAARSLCVRESRFNQQVCKAEAQRRAERDYHAYLRTVPRGEKPKHTISYYDNSSSCSSAEGQCKGEFHDCYASCGGQVIARRICTSQCEELKPPVSPGAQVGPTLVNGNPERTQSAKATAAARPQKPGQRVAPGSGRLAQSYSVSGSSGDDNSYEGTVTIRPDGDRYRVRWKIGSETYNGVGTLNGNRLTIEGGQPGEAFRYDLRVESDGTVSGRWTGDEGDGTEEWTPS